MIGWVIVGVGVVSAFLYRASKGPTWRGWNIEVSKDLFGEDDDV